MTPGLILVGGGLANGLLAARLAVTRPEVRFIVLEAGAALGGEHTWSFHATDVAPPTLEWLTALGARAFDGHEVRLPDRVRTLAGSYHSLRSDDFHRALAPLLGDRVRLGARAVQVSATQVTLESGERLEANAVIDARAVMPAWPCGWQKFLGREVELEAPHGLLRPLLMDATVAQLDGFRFIYALPWSADRLLIEDTVYSDTPQLDRDAFRARIGAWARSRGYRIRRVVREECAALPLPCEGSAPRLERPLLGVSAGFFHATTGYSLPWAARLAGAIAALPRLEAPQLTAFLQREASRHWRAQRFFRLLNRLLFRAAAPAARVRVFSSFYGHDEALIARFYAGALRPTDLLRVLARGANTVPAMRAVAAATRGSPIGDAPAT